MLHHGTLLECWCPLPDPSAHGSLPSALGLWYTKPCPPPGDILLALPGFWHPSLGLGSSSSDAASHRPCSVPPSDFRTVLIRKVREKKGEVRKGEGRTLELILLCVLHKCLWFCHSSLSESFYKVIQRILETTPLPLFQEFLKIVPFSFLQWGIDNVGQGELS